MHEAKLRVLTAHAVCHRPSGGSIGLQVLALKIYRKDQTSCFTAGYGTKFDNSGSAGKVFHPTSTAWVQLPSLWIRTDRGRNQHSILSPFLVSPTHIDFLSYTLFNKLHLFSPPHRQCTQDVEKHKGSRSTVQSPYHQHSSSKLQASWPLF